jgi:hypothetical protein
VVVPPAASRLRAPRAHDEAAYRRSRYPRAGAIVPASDLEGRARGRFGDVPAVVELDGTDVGDGDAELVRSAFTFDGLELDPAAGHGDELPLDATAVLEHERVRPCGTRDGEDG